MMKSNPDVSTTVQTIFTHMLSRIPRKITQPTKNTRPMATSLIGNTMPTAFSRFSAIAWAPVAMLVSPLIITAMPTM